MKFNLKSDYEPKGDQPTAIKELVSGIKNKDKYQTLLGVTGSGKTFTVANIINEVQKPTIVLAHNKTLAAQLYNELKELFPENRVEYFVSYYDYYQPESYIPSKDQYIEKDAQINESLERMRLATTASLSQRKDVIVVASVSAIYGLGDPKDFVKMGFEIKVGEKIERKKLLTKLINAQYERNDMELMSGRFRVKGDTIDFVPSYGQNTIRIEMFGDEIESMKEIHKVDSKIIDSMNYLYVYPAKHFVMPESKIKQAMKSIQKELDKRLPELDIVEAQRLKQRTLYDIEMIEETGFCKGIENYSLHFENRKSGEPPFCLLNYFPENFLIIIDESHQTLPQYKAMYKGDRSRKQNLVDYGFRLPSALDNRPLKFEEFEKILEKNQTIFVSATPAEYEITKSNKIAEQIIRPTGLLDPVVNVHPISGQIEDLKNEIQQTIKKGFRALVTTLTKKLAEELTEYLSKQGIKTRYLHSDIETLERTELIRQLRLGKFDVLVGINLLREGLDIPEVGFIGIMDADKEGFLRNTRSLIQIIGRAARNSESHVTLYADKMTDSIKQALKETNRRREKQIRFNKEHNITPKTIIKKIREKEVDIKDTKHIPKGDIPKMLINIEMDMRAAADNLDFEEAIKLREKLLNLKKRIEL
ncbi:excinuclease ABC subunit UvrB [Candidatus Woesearchaeota archaeon]|nr:excinuclease ABC subunit UvrB [Candidatus Woesearchaeota archaeon]MCF8013020.1 excinuclease ABC subunit UvrB [Candidatus Woesearchaeota archaeon]